MSNPERPYHIEPILERRESEPIEHVPTITLIRHGKTAYKELEDPDFHFDPSAEDFVLDAEHTDLTPEGIADVQQTARQLAEQIDPEQEAVFLFTSPNYRAQSTALIIEQVLREQGIELVNTQPQDTQNKTPATIRRSRMLEQITMKDPAMQSDFSHGHTDYFQDYPDARDAESVASRHEAISKRMGSSVRELFTKDHQQLGIEMNRWLRHMISIESHLQEQTKSALADKQIRIIGVTHEERLDELAMDAFGPDTHIARGQMMHISPDSRLRSGASSEAHVTLYGLDGSVQKEQDIAMSFQKES